ncbi:MAG TPA: type II toxin-antitoxin system RelE/ParE family toxin [Dongiaceae bacterium]|nr:type II toxin-antitoxin system RelE/ParE family toxin [Dongiaceae bacterium]
MAYRVDWLPAARRMLRKLDPATREHIVRAILLLEGDPRPPGAKKLAGRDNLWRVRIGDHRVIYAIEDDRLLVVVVTVGHRREVYRGLRRR